MKRINTIGLIMVVWMLLSTMAWSQQQLHVVTRKIDKTLAYKSGYQLVINGQKAEVKLDTWERNEVQVKMRLIAKHPELEQARRDSKLMNYGAERIGKKIYIQNSIFLKEGAEKPASNLKAEYEILVPKNCSVSVGNSFGKIKIFNVTKKVIIDAEFCQIDLDKIEGELDITTKFGDITGTHLDGTMKIQAHRSNVTLKELKGDFDINAKYGVITIDADQNLAKLNIKAEKSDVILPHSSQQYQYNLATTFGKITVPDVMKFKFTTNTKEAQKAELKPNQPQALVTISTAYGNITIQQ